MERGTSRRIMIHAGAMPYQSDYLSVDSVVLLPLGKGQEGRLKLSESQQVELIHFDLPPKRSPPSMLFLGTRFLQAAGGVASLGLGAQPAAFVRGAEGQNPTSITSAAM